jgi:putative MFS transporter
VITDSFGVYASLGACLVSLLFGGIVCHIWAPETSQTVVASMERKAS